VFAQDKWTINRLTIGVGGRFDHVHMIAPATHVGPSTLTPTRDFTLPEVLLANYNDVTPRTSVAYDLTGDGKTAVKVSLNKYLTNTALGTAAPALQSQTTATRAWTDANNNLVPDCDLTNGGAQDLRPTGGDLCGAYTGANVNFGRPVINLINDPKSVSGWGTRHYNWEFSAGVQRQIFPRVSLDVNYFRRWYGNFVITDNLAVSAPDFGTFSVTTPADSRLPAGGGQTVSGHVNLNPDAATRTPNQHQVLVDDSYGNIIARWNGVDVTTVARLGQGVMLQGGVSTGHSLFDACDVMQKVPELGLAANGVTTPTATLPALTNPFCRQDQNWLTQVKLIGTYLVPRIDVNFAATLQSYPGPEINANYVATNAQVQPSLGRPLSGNAANITLPIIAPRTVYGDRINQLDLRFGKLVRVGPTRSMFSVDIYNALNSDAPLTESATYSIFRRPTAVAAARFVKFTVQFDF